MRVTNLGKLSRSLSFNFQRSSSITNKCVKLPNFEQLWTYELTERAAAWPWEAVFT